MKVDGAPTVFSRRFAAVSRPMSTAGTARMAMTKITMMSAVTVHLLLGEYPPIGARCG